MVNSKNNVLVTGAAGFLGRYISKFYSEQGWNVVGLDTVGEEKSLMLNLSAYHQVQLPDPALDKILKSGKFNVCVHCAGRASVNLSVDDPDADFQSNTVVTFALLNSIRLYSPDCRMILLSSAAVYGNPETLPVTEEAVTNPMSPYGFHKLQCETICKEFSTVYGLRTASARIFSAYGQGLKRQVIWDILYKALTQPVVKLQGTGNESRDFIHAEDIANAVFCILRSAPMEGEYYNVASGVEVSIKELADLIVSNMPFHGTIEYDGAVPVGVPLNWRSDISNLKKLGFKPVISLEKGINMFREWAIPEISKE